MVVPRSTQWVGTDHIPLYRPSLLFLFDVPPCYFSLSLLVVPICNSCPRFKGLCLSGVPAGLVRRSRAALTHRRKLAEDDEFVLQTVTVFKKVRDEFVHKARENKWVAAGRWGPLVAAYLRAKG